MSSTCRWTPAACPPVYRPVRPGLVLWVKYDYWYYYLVELKKRNIPTVLVSGVFRTDQPFFKWYGRLHRYMLECFTHLFVQTETSKTLWKGWDLRRCQHQRRYTVDRVIAIAENAEPLPSIASFCGQQPVIVAGSTWKKMKKSWIIMPIRIRK